MNICYFYDYLGTGGSEVYSLRLAELLNRDGNRVSILYNKIEKGAPSNKLDFKQINNSGTFDISGALKLKKYFDEKKIDIVHVHFPREQFLCVLAKIFGSKVKIVRTYHRMDRFTLKSWILDRLLGRWVDSYIALTGYAKEQMTKSGVPKQRIKVIPNGVDEIIARNHGRGVGYLGRVVPEKGIFEVAKMWPADGPDLIIAGEGSDKARIENLKRKNVKLLGKVDDLSSFFEGISLLVLPSSSETMPLSILESFSAGVPVITFDIPALKEIVSDEVGIRVPDGDFAAFVRETLMIMKNEKKMTDFSINAINEFRIKYNQENVFKNVKALYKALLG